MEILVIILAELLTPVLISLSSLAFGLIVLIIQIPFLIFECAATALLEAFSKKLADDWKSWRKKRLDSVEEIPKQETAEEPVPVEATLPVVAKTGGKGKRKTLHRIAVWSVVACCSFLVLFFLAIVIANAFFFESTLRFALRQVESRTQIAVAFKKAEGDFWTGRLRLSNVSIKRMNHAVSRFDLQGEQVEIKLSMPKLLRYSFVFQTVQISKFSGTWEQVGKSEKLKPRRNFRIDRLVMDDIRLDYTDRTKEKGPFQTTIRLDTLESSPLSSDWVVFDALFRSKGRGSVNDIPFVVDSERGKHSCRMNDVPVELLAHYVGTLDWFDKGKVDLLIEDNFNDPGIMMRWSLVFHDFHVKAPEGTPLKLKAAALPLVTFLNLKSKRLPLEFELQLKKDDFRFQSSTELNDVARIVLGEKIMDALKTVKDKNRTDDER